MDSKINVHQCQIAPSVSVQTKVNFMGDDQKVRLEIPTVHCDNQQSFWENILWADETKLGLYVHRCIQRKEHCPYCETLRRLSYFLGLLCWIWHKVSWICAWNHEILKLSRHSGEKCLSSVKKLGLSPLTGDGCPGDNWCPLFGRWSYCYGWSSNFFSLFTPLAPWFSHNYKSSH